jgi:hypothetical protein
LIESNLDSLTIPPTKAYFADVASDGTIEHTDVKGKISSFLNTRGTMESLIFNMELDSRGQLGGRDFEQKQSIFYSWELQGTYKF